MSHRAILILLAIVLIGGLFRIYHLGTQSIWFDEAASIRGSSQSLVLVVQSSGRLHNQPPLYFALLHLWMRLFGTSEIAVRSLSAIFGIISLFVIYQVGCKLFDPHVGLISSFLSAISCFYIYYSQEARAYSLLQLLTLLSFFCFIEALRADRRRGFYFALLFLINVSVVYTHPYGLFVILSQTIYFFLLWARYHRLRYWFFGVQLGVIASFAPWIPNLFERIPQISQDFWILRPSFVDIVHTIRDYASGSYSLTAFLVFSILCFIGLVAIRKGDDGWNPRKLLQRITGKGGSGSAEYIEENLLLLIWLACPIVIPFVISQFSTPIYTLRYTIGASPAFYLLVARGISVFNRRRVLYVSIVVLLFLLSLPGLVNYYSYYTKDQWRETAGFIEHNSRAKDVIIMWPDNWGLPFAYYYKGNLQIAGIDKDVHDSEKIKSAIDEAVAGKERLWLVLSGGGTFYPKFLLERFGSRSLKGHKNFFRVIEVYLFDIGAGPKHSD